MATVDERVKALIAAALASRHLSPMALSNGYAQFEMEGGVRADHFDPFDRAEVDLVANLVAQGYGAPDVTSIKRKLAELDLDQETKERWFTELVGASATGFFCPSIEEEMAAAIEALCAGQVVPSFSRTG